MKICLRERSARVVTVISRKLEHGLKYDSSWELPLVYLLGYAEKDVPAFRSLITVCNPGSVWFYPLMLKQLAGSPADDTNSKIGVIYTLYC